MSEENSETSDLERLLIEASKRTAESLAVPPEKAKEIILAFLQDLRDGSSESADEDSLIDDITDDPDTPEGIILPCGAPIKDGKPSRIVDVTDDPNEPDSFMIMGIPPGPRKKNPKS